MSEYSDDRCLSLEPSINKHVDLVSFLSIIQACEVEIMSVTWQPGLESLGSGATAVEVSQSIVSRQVGYAYKRVDGETSKSSSKFTPIIDEVRALRCAGVKAHPNVVDLEGICWETQTSVVLPVLVFRKAEFGDLRSFMQTPRGAELLLDEKLRLCVDIGRGLQALHHSGYVHCDLKPQNILVYVEENGNLLAKIADLAYARYGLREDDMVTIPRSRPWVDPNWHQRMHEIQIAKKMDMYSFGMVCLYILLEKQFLDHLAESQHPGSTEISFFGSEFESGSYDVIEELQQKDKLHSVVEQVLKISSFELVSKSTVLAVFFQRLLCKDQTLRKTDFTRLFHFQGQGTECLFLDDAAKFDSKPLETPLHAHFRIAVSNYRLCGTDYRVRSTIFHSLLSRTVVTDKLYCKDCSKLASFQLAVCYALGFGVAKDEEKRRIHLEASARSQSDLEIEIGLLKKRVLDSTYTSSTFRELFDQGHITRIDPEQHYRDQKTLIMAKLEYEREARDMESVLGIGHAAVLLLKTTLTAIYRKMGNLHESKKLGMKVMVTFKVFFGPDHPDTLISMTNVVRTLIKLKLWKDVKLLQEQILDARLHEQGPDHSSTLIAVGELAMTYLQFGKLKEAEEMMRYTAERFSVIYTESHPQTLNALSNVAVTLNAQDRDAEALPILKRVFEEKQRVIGPADPSTLSTAHDLAIVYSKLGMSAEAGDLHHKVLELMKGKNHDDRLTYMSNFATSLCKAGNFAGAKGFQELVVNERKEFFGIVHPSTLKSLAYLATIYGDEEDWAKQDIAISEVMKECASALASEHPEALEALSLVASIYHQRGRIEEARMLFFQVVEIQRNRLNILNEGVLIDMNNLAMTFYSSDLPSEAVELFSLTKEAFEGMFGPENEKTLQTSGNLAMAYNKAGDHGKAESLLLEIKAITIRVGDFNSLELLGCNDYIASVYAAQELWEKQQKVYEESFNICVHLFGLEDKRTLKRMTQLALACGKLKEWRRAEKLHRSVIAIREKAEGSAHIDTMAARNHLAQLFKQEQNWAEAILQLKVMVKEAAENIGDDDDLTLSFLTQLASCHWQKGEIHDAAIIQTSLVQLRETKSGLGDELTLTAKLKLAEMLTESGNFEEAEKTYAAVSKDSTASLGPEHPLTLTSEKLLSIVSKLNLPKLTRKVEIKC